MKPIILSLILCFQIFALGQEKTSIVTNKQYFENLVLNTDRELYIVGEKIWFKVSCFDNGGRPDSIISKIAYLELYDYKTKTIAKAKYRIINGTANGFIKIPDNLNTGSYYLRAYTHFLRNYSPYLYPVSLISIVNPNKTAVNNTENKPDNDILIVPEGGKFIAGTPTKLAVRINPLLNKHISRATIINDKNNKAIKLATFKNGLAMFKITPELNIKYSLKLILNNSDSILKPLPQTVNKGVVLHSNYENSKLKISLISVNETKTGYKVELKSQNLTNLFSKSIKPSQTVEIADKQLTEGLIYILLKNTENEIINVSSKYIAKNAAEKIKIKKSKEIFNKREAVELDINLPKNCSTNSKFSITVTKVDKSNNSKKLLPSHIAYNPVLLPNYLKNNIIDNDSIRKQIGIATILYSVQYNLDDFEGIFKESKIEYLPEIRDISISGKIIDENLKIPLGDVLVYASVFGENKQIHLYKTNAKGEFFFTLNHLVGKQDVFIGTKPTDTLQVEILINNDFSNKYPKTGSIPLNFDSSNYKLPESLYFNAQINKAFENHVEKTDENISYYPLTDNNAGVSVFLKDFIHIPLMAEVFDEIIPAVFTGKKKGRYYLKIYDEIAVESKKEPLVLLDGVPVFDIDQIMKIPSGLITKINVVKGKYYLGDYIINGMIGLSSKTKNFAGITFPKESVFVEYQAISTEVYPLFPNYGLHNKNNRIPDFRNLLYYDSHLIFKQSNKKIKFFTSDDFGDYQIIIKGYGNNKQYFGKSYVKVKRNTAE